ncbi:MULTISPECIES: hypothetical protein, partial [Salmonella]|uniref:hypothetical protein n=1 Tax=Salmonella TaxID=590 RepID=UPI0031FC91DB
IHGPRPDGPSHATFKSAPGRFVLTPVTSLSMLLGTHSLAAFTQLELFWVYISELLFLSVFIFQFIYY